MKAITNLDSGLPLAEMLFPTAGSGTNPASDGEFAKIMKDLMRKKPDETSQTESQKDSKPAKPAARTVSPREAALLRKLRTKERPSQPKSEKADSKPISADKTDGSEKTRESDRADTEESTGTTQSVTSSQPESEPSNEPVTDPEKLGNRSMEIILAMSAGNGSSPEEILEALEADEKTGSFWKALDDETAKALLSSMQDPSQAQPVLSVISDLLGKQETGASPNEELEDLRKDATTARILETMGDSATARILKALREFRQALSKSPEEKPSEGEEKGADSENQIKTAKSADGETRRSEKPGVTKDGKQAAEKSSITGENQKLPGTADKEHPQQIAPSKAKNSENPAIQQAGEAAQKANSAQTSAAAPVPETRSAFVISSAGTEQPDGSRLEENLRARISAAQTARTTQAETAVKAMSNKSFHQSFGQPDLAGENSGRAAEGKAAQQLPKFSDPVHATLFSQIIERAELFKGPQQQKLLTIQLKPEALGKLNLELSSKDGTVTAKIFAESPVVKEKLEQILPQIKDNLAAQGINLSQIVVDIFSKNPDERKEGFFQNGRRAGKISPTAVRSSEPAPIDVLPEIRKIALNISAVDITV